MLKTNLVNHIGSIIFDIANGKTINFTISFQMAFTSSVFVHRL